MANDGKGEAKPPEKPAAAAAGVQAQFVDEFGLDGLSNALQRYSEAVGGQKREVQR
jgi:hypothetical protein